LCPPPRARLIYTYIYIYLAWGVVTCRDLMAADYPACEMYNISQVEHLALLVEKSIGMILLLLLLVIT
jgi:hypothetical protein